MREGEGGKKKKPHHTQLHAVTPYTLQTYYSKTNTKVKISPDPKKMLLFL